jgi:4-hydroxybenzoate polyprenyltransferase
MAVLAGAALAIANARSDLERDVAAGTVSIATRLGLERSWRVHAGLWLAVLLIGLGWLAFRGVGPAQAAPVVGAAGLIVATVAWSREQQATGRERAWEFEAVAATLALSTWLLAALR